MYSEDHQRENQYYQEDQGDQHEVVKKIQKTIRLTLAGLNGNAHVLMGAFSTQAEKEGWTEQEIEEVIKDAMSSDYQHLLTTLNRHCQ